MVSFKNLLFFTTNYRRPTHLAGPALGAGGASPYKFCKISTLANRYAIKQSFYDDLHVMISSRNRIVCVKSTVIVYLVIASTRRQKQFTLSRLYYTKSFSCMSKKTRLGVPSIAGRLLKVIETCVFDLSLQTHTPLH